MPAKNGGFSARAKWRLARISRRTAMLIADIVGRSRILKFPVGRRSLGQRLGGFLSSHQDLTIIRWGNQVLPLVPLFRTAFQTYEPDTTRLFERIVQPGMTIVDVGAEIGHYTLLGARLVGGTGRVYAFEPDPNTLPILRRNVEQSGREQPVIIVPMAVTDVAGEGPFYPGKGGTSSLLSVRYEERESVAVEITSLDLFFSERNWPSIGLVKIDIEGAEKYALHGMKELVARNPRIALIIEFCPEAIKDTGGTPNELGDALLAAGFRNFWLITDDLEKVNLPADLASLVERVGHGVANLLCKTEQDS